MSQENDLSHLQAKKRTEFIKLIKDRLDASWKKQTSTGVLKSIISLLQNPQTDTLGTDAAELGLLLINRHPDYKSEEHQYTPDFHIEYRSPRYNRIEELLGQQYWDDPRNFQLLEFLLGDQKKAIYARHAWKKIPNEIYQRGYYRHSFRSPFNKEIYQPIQFDFIADLIHQVYTSEYKFDGGNTGYLLTHYDLTIIEQVRYSHQLGEANPALFRIWAAAIDLGNDQLFTLMEDIIFNKAPEGKLTRAIIKALITSDKLIAWQLVEKLLLAAQRQEGLRQTILEALDETSIGALKYLMKVMVDHQLARFASTVRAVDVWMGLGWGTERENTVSGFLEKGLYYLENTSEISDAIYAPNNADVYIALWAQGVYDVEKTLPLLQDLYRTGDTQKRSLALYFALQTRHYKVNIPMQASALADPDFQPLAIATAAIQESASLKGNDKYYNQYFPQLFNQLHETYKRISVKEQKFEGWLFSWLTIEFKRKTILQAMTNLVGEDQTRLDLMLNYLKDMDADLKGLLTRKILPEFSAYGFKPGVTKTSPLTTMQRRYAMLTLGDRSEFRQAYNALFNVPFQPEEWPVFSDLLKRKAAGFRSNLITLILQQNDEALTTVLEEVLIQGDPEQRLAGLDILLQLRKTQRLKDRIPVWLNAFSQRRNISQKEEVLLQQLKDEQPATDLSATNGYGLFTPKNGYHPPLPPIDKENIYEKLRDKNITAYSHSIEHSRKAMAALEALLLLHKDHEYEITNWDNSKEKILLANAFQQARPNQKFETPEQQYRDYPLPDVWIEWFHQWDLHPQDLVLFDMTSIKRVHNTLLPQPAELLPASQIETPYWRNKLVRVLNALTLKFPYPQKDELLLGMTTRLFNMLNENTLRYKQENNNTYYSHSQGFGWQQIAELNDLLKNINAANIQEELIPLYWQLYDWRQFSGLPENIEPSMPPLPVFCLAHKTGLIDKQELFRGILTQQNIRSLSNKLLHKNDFDYYTAFPFLIYMFPYLREYLLDIELKRGDTPTPVTKFTDHLESIYGTDRFAQTIVGLGKTTLYNDYIYSWTENASSKQQSFSSLLKKCHPLPDDTQQTFDETMKKIRVSENRLIEIAMYAPQWQKFISNYLGWPGLDTAIWWMHAHTKNDAFNARNADSESEIARHSALDLQDFKNGSVDKDWFLQAYREIGPEKWPLIYNAAKYITDGNGHRRARIYADVLLGNLGFSQVQEKIQTKRDQDYLRIYGLIPLSRTSTENDVLSRYEYLQQFKKESRQFGAMKQTSEAAAVQIAMENLARNAGYADPVRLTWAMEIRQVREILAKETQVQYDDVLIGLVIDEEGLADIVAFKEDKPLKAIPAKYKKDTKIAELNTWKKTLREQFRRSKKGLEDAMVNGDVFYTEEISRLFSHPVIAKHLENIVFTLETTQEQIQPTHGFFRDGALVDTEGRIFNLDPKTQIRITHCTDLHKSNVWAAYQRYAFDNKIQQPFKQIFRELYIPTADELQEASISRRYASHQVQPKQTLALLKTRGWKIDHEQGLQKVFHKQGFAVKLYAMADWFSPAEMESPTLDTIQLEDLKTFETRPFDTIDPRIFSEFMRDIDLVVSVAHAGNVDPEASHSTIEMRSVLLKETARLFKLDNVSINGSHVRISGKLGEYSIHIGSAIVHRFASGSLSILPVHAQQRGRIFLPFVDDDPRSAELISKVLLLARDHQIQDPTILRQLSDH